MGWYSVAYVVGFRAWAFLSLATADLFPRLFLRGTKEVIVGILPRMHGARRATVARVVDAKSRAENGATCISRGGVAGK